MIKPESSNVVGFPGTPRSVLQGCLDNVDSMEDVIVLYKCKGHAAMDYECSGMTHGAFFYYAAWLSHRSQAECFE